MLAVGPTLGEGQAGQRPWALGAVGPESLCVISNY
jgi:hypothetical protein